MKIEHSFGETLLTNIYMCRLIWQIFQDGVLFCIPWMILISSFSLVQFMFWRVCLDFEQITWAYLADFNTNRTGCDRCWTSDHFIQVKWQFLSYSADFLFSLFLVLNHYRFKIVRYKLIKARRKKQEQMGESVDSKRSSRYLAWKEFGQVIGHWTYLAIYLCGAIAIFYFHSFQILHLTGLSKSVFQKAVKHIYNPITYAMFCLVIGSINLAFFMVMTILSFGFALSHRNCRCLCCRTWEKKQSQSEAESADEIQMTTIQVNS